VLGDAVNVVSHLRVSHILEVLGHSYKILLGRFLGDMKAILPKALGGFREGERDCGKSQDSWFGLYFMTRSSCFAT